GLRDYTNAAIALCTGAKGAVTTVLHSSSAELGCERFSHVHISCGSEMFLYLVRGIFCGGAHGLNCSDGGLTRFRGEKQRGRGGSHKNDKTDFLPARPGAYTSGARRNRGRPVTPFGT